MAAWRVGGAAEVGQDQGGIGILPPRADRVPAALQHGPAHRHLGRFTLAQAERPCGNVLDVTAVAVDA
jgi:hypothetical protein